MRHPALSYALVAVLAVAFVAPSFADPPDRQCSNRFTRSSVETFNEAINGRTWNFDDFTNDLYGDAKGKRGTFLENFGITAGYPVAKTRQILEVQKDWRARNVFSFGADLMVRNASLQLYEERFVSVLLVNDSGTPDDPNDDCIVFYASDRNIPIPRKQDQNRWESYDFDVPASSPTLPQPNAGISCAPGTSCETCPVLGEPCWGVFQFNDCPTRGDLDATWNTVIQDVDQIRVSFQHPEFLSLLQDWWVGIDNVGEVYCLQ